MDPVTPEQLQKAVQEKGIQRWMLRRCSICNTGLYYFFEGADVLFDSSCDCGGWSPPRPAGYEGVVRTLNMQTSEIRSRMWDELMSNATAPA